MDKVQRESIVASLFQAGGLCNKVHKRQFINYGLKNLYSFARVWYFPDAVVWDDRACVTRWGCRGIVGSVRA